MVDFSVLGAGSINSIPSVEVFRLACAICATKNEVTALSCSNEHIQRGSAVHGKIPHVRTILLVATALVALTCCQGAGEKQGAEAVAQSGDLANCAQIREVPGGCRRNASLAEVYVDNMHKNRTVRATVRKHSQEGDEDTEYAIAGGGQLFIGCGGDGTSFVVVRCEILKGETERGDTR